MLAKNFCQKVAKVMKVSEGTAYRAIKDAGQLGLVTTIDRVGTVRIDKRIVRRLRTLRLMKF